MGNSTPGIENPLFAFKARGLKAGDKLQVSWADSNGEKA